jgi:hypothetical protein
VASEEDEESSDSEYSDDDDYSDSEYDEEDDDEDLDEEGMSWDELEKQAEEDDRKAATRRQAKDEPVNKQKRGVAGGRK